MHSESSTVVMPLAANIVVGLIAGYAAGFVYDSNFLGSHGNLAAEEDAITNISTGARHGSQTAEAAGEVFAFRS